MPDSAIFCTYFRQPQGNTIEADNQIGIQHIQGKCPTLRTITLVVVSVSWFLIAYKYFYAYNDIVSLPDYLFCSMVISRSLLPYNLSRTLQCSISFVCYIAVFQGFFSSGTVLFIYFIDTPCFILHSL